jgi:multidrug efflux system membrane fusion protein
MEHLTTPNKQNVPSHTPFYRQLRFWILILFIELLIIFFQYVIPRSAHPIKTTPLPVVIAGIQKKDVPVYLSALGTVIPTYSVTVKTQVSGQLLKVLFKEGQLVKTGDPLAEIDPRPFQAQLLQYQGQLARDQALLTNAQLDLKRYQILWKQDSVAQQTLDTQKSLVAQYEGNIKVDEGLIETTKVNLLYTHIISPMDGRVGLRLVDPGNIVQPSDQTGLVNINMLNPITVVFTLAEDQIPAVLKQMNAQKTLVVEAYNRTQQQLLAKGTVLTIDNQIDPTTGTVKLKAQFNNEENLLFPSQFVNIKLLLEILPHALIVPTAAIQHGVQGDFVFLLNPDQTTVKVQPVITDIAYGEETVITSGLAFGESVVIEGADKLTNGAIVSISNTTQNRAEKVASQRASAA